MLGEDVSVLRLLDVLPGSQVKQLVILKIELGGGEGEDERSGSAAKHALYIHKLVLQY